MNRRDRGPDPFTFKGQGEPPLADRANSRTRENGGGARPRVFKVVKQTMGTSRPHPGS